jgi:hypothetical protein
MIIFANILLDKQVITPTTFTALLLMAVGSTMLTKPFATPLIARLGERLKAEAYRRRCPCWRHMRHCPEAKK